MNAEAGSLQAAACGREKLDDTVHIDSNFHEKEKRREEEEARELRTRRLQSAAGNLATPC